MLTVPPSTKLWFAAAVDLRLGFDGLAGLVRTQLHADPLSGHLFVFTNRSANRVKVLYWGGHGLCLWCQRLEAGRYGSFSACISSKGVVPAVQYSLCGVESRAAACDFWTAA